MSRPQLKPREVHYPESDGQPMAETDPHRDLMTDLIGALKCRFRDDPDLYVSGNLFIYYQEGHPEMSVAPDLFVVRGVPKRDRRTYKVWEEGKGPDLVVELTSKDTRNKDLGEKKVIYEDLGVKEYFLFDPLGEWLHPPLRGYRLEGHTLTPFEPLREEPALQVFTSQVLGLELHGTPGSLRWVDPRTGEVLLTFLENYDQRQAEKARADKEKARAEAEKARAEVQRARAAAQAARADAAEAETARLRSELERLRAGGDVP